MECMDADRLSNMVYLAVITQILIWWHSHGDSMEINEVIEHGER